jgi:hypothetical protein
MKYSIILSLVIVVAAVIYGSLVIYLSKRKIISRFAGGTVTLRDMRFSQNGYIPVLISIFHHEDDHHLSAVIPVYLIPYPAKYVE